jgi:hypothetical protein
MRKDMPQSQTKEIPISAAALTPQQQLEFILTCGSDTLKGVTLCTLKLACNEVLEESARISAATNDEDPKRM